eukprot:CAMPEP_0204212056 /NCGR_PEP_ID=MMETSP0361-20130328/74961_1 /ASSEMBLY_ACC=CAM_ASM_000343 /TAXON_ID=268821 /ORGANISM="Scrippsiella Hangoei, Strain SHTV-5" /LENGTH=68 /DNA_ID=CAMNT_0051176337 /DNA_START=106 /DNA_END=312 /DNA_ORIENTATION=+
MISPSASRNPAAVPTELRPCDRGVTAGNGRASDKPASERPDMRPDDCGRPRDRCLGGGEEATDANLFD